MPPTITPASVTLKNNYVRQFYATGIPSPIWTLYGPGSLDQNGIYIAPPTGWGDYEVEAASPFWLNTNTANLQQNSDDSLTVLQTNWLWQQAESNANLTQPNDYFEVELYDPACYVVLATNAARDKIFGLQSSCTYELFGGPPVIGSGNSFSVGDIIRIERLADHRLRVSKNGSSLGLSINQFNFPVHLELGLSPLTDLGCVIKKPKVRGPGITNYTSAQASIFIQPELLTPTEGCELYCDPHLLSSANGTSISNLADVSGNHRHLTAASPAPILQTNVLNGKSVARFNESQPLKNPAPFPVRCGWMVVKYDGPYFPVYTGLLTGYQYAAILVGNIFNTIFYYFLDKFFEVRSNDRVYPASNAPAPMQEYRIIFFRFWNQPIQMDGVQLGTDRDFASRLWKGDVALLALYSRDFTEEEIRASTKRIADNFELPLADVYPYQADTSDTTETPAHSVNVYDPPEGERIVEVLDDPKRLLELKFSVADQSEIRQMQEFHRTHFPEVPCIYRDYRFTPPEDIEGYIDTPYELDGSNNDFEYSFRFREK
jgi:hypothetical protein